MPIVGSIVSISGQIKRPAKYELLGGENLLDLIDISGGPSWLDADGSPAKNVWFGVTIENQKMADRRLADIVQIQTDNLYVSYEPALGPVDFRPYLHAIKWLVAGGESGPGARPMHPDWVHSVRDRCRDAGVPFFFKQWGEWAPVAGYDPDNRKKHFCFDAPSKMTPQLKEYNGLSSANMYKFGKKKAGRPY